MSNFSSHYQAQQFEALNISIDQLEQSTFEPFKQEVNQNESPSFIDQSEVYEFQDFSDWRNSKNHGKSRESSLFIDRSLYIQEMPSQLPKSKLKQKKLSPIKKKQMKQSFKQKQTQSKTSRQYDPHIDQQQLGQRLQKPCQKLSDSQFQFKQKRTRQSNRVQFEANNKLKTDQKPQNTNFPAFMPNQQNVSRNQFKQVQKQILSKDYAQKTVLTQKIPVVISTFFQCPNLSKYFPIKLPIQNKPQRIIKLGTDQAEESQDSLDSFSSNDSWPEELTKEQQKQRKLQNMSYQQRGQLLDRKIYLVRRKQEDVQTQTYQIKLADSLQQKIVGPSRMNSEDSEYLDQKILSVAKHFDSESQLNLEEYLKQYQMRKQYLIQHNQRDGQTQTDDMLINQKAYSPYTKSNLIISTTIWKKMLQFCDYCTTKMPTPSQLLLLNKNTTEAWKLLISICRIVSKRLISSKNFSCFVQTIKLIQNFFNNTFYSKNPISDVNYFLLFKLSVQGFDIPQLSFAMRDLQIYFVRSQKLFPPFIKFALKFFIKKYFQFAYESLTEKGKKSINIDRILECIDLLFKYSIVPKIDRFFKIQTENQIEILDQNKEKQIKRLGDLLRQISMSQVFFCRIFEQKSFPWLGIFTEPFKRMKKKQLH